MTPLGVATDIGGSLRWPSQYNGTSALKPSLGRVPRATSIEPMDAPLSFQLTNVYGPMARGVADLRLALDVMSRPSGRDPWYVPAPLVGPAVGGHTRVAVVEDPAGTRTSPQVAKGVRRAAEQLQASGYEVESVEPPEIGRVAQVWFNVAGPDLRLAWPQMSPLAQRMPSGSCRSSSR